MNKTLLIQFQITKAYHSINISHSKTLSKFNLYSSEIGLYYLSEILKPVFICILLLF